MWLDWRTHDTTHACISVYPFALQHTATHCNTLQHIATHCNTLHHTATHCNTLQHTACISVYPFAKETYERMKHHTWMLTHEWTTTYVYISVYSFAKETLFFAKEAYEGMNKHTWMLTHEWTTTNYLYVFVRGRKMCVGVSLLCVGVSLLCVLLPPHLFLPRTNTRCVWKDLRV